MNKVIIESHQNTMLQSLQQYYTTHTHHLDTLLRILQTSKPSISIIEWFVKHYSNRKGIHYEDNKGCEFWVHAEYKLQVTGYSKKKFDPFCRNERIQFWYNNNTYLETTIGQLKFFQWAFENGIIRYIETHYKEIEADMIANKKTKVVVKPKEKYIQVMFSDATNK